MREDAKPTAEPVTAILVPLADPDRCYDLDATICYDNPWGWSPLQLFFFREAGYAEFVKGYRHPLPADVYRRWRESELFTRSEVAAAEAWLGEHELIMELKTNRLDGLPPSATPRTMTDAGDPKNVWTFWDRVGYDLPFRLEASCDMDRMYRHEGTMDNDWANRSFERVRKLGRRLSSDLRELESWIGALHCIEISVTSKEMPEE